MKTFILVALASLSVGCTIAPLHTPQYASQQLPVKPATNLVCPSLTCPTVNVEESKVVLGADFLAKACPQAKPRYIQSNCPPAQKTVEPTPCGLTAKTIGNIDKLQAFDPVKLRSGGMTEVELFKASLGWINSSKIVFGKVNEEIAKCQ